MASEVIKAFLFDASGTVNAIAKAQNWPTVKFEIDGEVYEANSIWAATDWLKSRGLSKTGRHRWLTDLTARRL